MAEASIYMRRYNSECMVGEKGGSGVIIDLGHSPESTEGDRRMWNACLSHINSCIFNNIILIISGTTNEEINYTSEIIT